MDKDTFFIIKNVAWVAAFALSWLYAAAGYTSTPRFDRWVWGIGFWVTFIILGAMITRLALRR